MILHSSGHDSFDARKDCVDASETSASRCTPRAYLRLRYRARTGGVGPTTMAAKLGFGISSFVSSISKRRSMTERITRSCR